MGTKTVAQKGHVRAGTTLAVVNPVERVLDSMGLPSVEIVDLREAELVFLFVHDREELESEMPALVSRLERGTTLWVFFRKGSRAAGLDMNRDDVWAIAAAGGMRPLGLVSVDDEWSAFRLRAPRPMDVEMTP